MNPGPQSNNTSSFHNVHIAPMSDKDNFEENEKQDERLRAKILSGDPASVSLQRHQVGVLAFVVNESAT